MQRLVLAANVFVLTALVMPLSARQVGPSASAAGDRPRAAESARVVPPDGYIIGPEDVLTIMFWKDKDMSGDVIVRPDGKISTPLLNDIQAAGLTPEELRVRINQEAANFPEDPNATVLVKQINRRKTIITG